MGRSPFTLAAAVTAALPGAEVTGARPLTADSDGRFDSAVATLADGRELAIRVAEDDEAGRELAAEALALRALTTGARAMLPFDAPAYIGETRLGDARALVTELLPGFQIEAAHVPSGRGAAESMGTAIAAVHALPTSVVRGAGLLTRTAQESRDEIARLVDTAAATGRVPARLTVRWREAVADDDLWRFESTVVLGGVQSTSFVFRDDPDAGPQVTGVIGWHALSVGDPAVDLSWLSTAPDAADDVHAAYATAIARVPDPALEVRGRLLAELEFARWLVHGDALHRTDIVDDAAALLEALADGLRHDDLSVISARGEGVDSAMDALGRVPASATSGASAVGSTAMETDAYNPDDLWHDEPGDADGRNGDATVGAGDADSTHDLSDAAAEAARRVAVGGIETEDLSAVQGRFSTSGHGNPATAASDDAGSPPADAASSAEDYQDTPEDEAQRAARAALQRWRSSDSE
ncbi:phosphotransferase [Microbacterium sp. 1.5R]|uniref:phosphotransferase n=1 Tax=Microbacterium sp. 1.5R TaxID=1916917 RepID=UPI0021B452BA|nr:phosphotransferase [Microbacterium sp. 1.5R]